MKRASEGEKKDEEEKEKTDLAKTEDMSMHSTNDDLEIIIALRKELESEKGKNISQQRDIKAKMRQVKDKAKIEAFQWKCKYEALLKETKGSQEDTPTEDPIETGKLKIKVADVPDDGKNDDKKKWSSDLPDNAIQTDGDEHEESIARRGMGIREFEDRMGKTDVKIAAVKQENNRLKEENEELRQRVSKFQDSLDTSVKERANLQTEMKLQRETTKDLSNKVKMKDDKIANMEHENNRLKEEDETLRLRLSEIAGSLLVNRNPTIADLSDVTRPTKLAEIYSELYDSQWTEAFEEQKGSEQEVIKVLLQFLMNIHSTCQKVSSEYLSELETKIITIPGSGTAIFKQTADIPATTRKFILEIRRSVSEQIIPVMITHFRNKFIRKEKKSRKEMKATAIYIEKCTELCWYMAIKDPPVTLGDIPKEGKPVNKELFRCYTRSGKHVDYCVWPPLLLHEDGPLLCKGIIQGK